MTALLTDNLPLLAGAPNGIKKLRELILELAVRGKLVPQDPSDEPASELLKRIAEEKARLVAEGKIRKPKQQPKAAEDDISFVLPNGWEVERLGVTSHLITKGTTPTTLGHAYTSSGISFVKVENIESRRISKTAISQFISPDTDELMSRSRLEAGDVLFSIAGTIGKTCSVQEEDLPANTNQALAIIRGTSTVFLQDFLLSQLDSFVSEKTKERARGGAMPNVSLGDLSDLVLVIPPLTEQHRIVAKVDELMALCDRLEARQADADSAHAQLVQALLNSLTQASDADDFAQSWQRLAEHFHTLFTTESSIDALKQTLLQLAVMGKLVPQDPNDEPASELLERIAEEKVRLVAEGKIKKQKLLADVDDEEHPYVLPSNWEWVRFGSVSSTRLGKMLDKAKNKGELRPYLRNTNVQWFNFEIEDLKSMRFEEHELDEYRVLYGDLVICEGGEPGRCAVWQGHAEDMFIQKALHRARPWLGISPFFLQFCLKAAADSGFLNQFFTGATIKHFSGEKLAKYPIPLPPLPEQHRIVAKIDQLTAICNQLKTRLSEARQLNEQLASTLVEQAVA